jgi:hypothetical protein
LKFKIHMCNNVALKIMYLLTSNFEFTYNRDLDYRNKIKQRHWLSEKNVLLSRKKALPWRKRSPVYTFFVLQKVARSDLNNISWKNELK